MGVEPCVQQGAHNVGLLDGLQLLCRPTWFPGVLLKPGFSHLLENSGIEAHEVLHYTNEMLMASEENNKKHIKPMVSSSAEKQWK